MIDIDALWDFGDPAGSETRFRRELLSSDPYLPTAEPTRLARLKNSGGVE